MAIFPVPADFVMSRQMLRGVKSQAERTPAADLPISDQPTGRTFASTRAGGAAV
jgi:hypothetical protein